MWLKDFGMTSGLEMFQAPQCISIANNGSLCNPLMVRDLILYCVPFYRNCVQEKVKVILYAQSMPSIVCTSNHSFGFLLKIMTNWFSLNVLQFLKSSSILDLIFIIFKLIYKIDL